MLSAADADAGLKHRVNRTDRQRQLLRQVQTEWIQYRVKACEFEKSGIEAWQKGHYMSFPFQSKNIDKTYGNQRLVLVPSR